MGISAFQASGFTAANQWRTWLSPGEAQMWEGTGETAMHVRILRPHSSKCGPQRNSMGLFSELLRAAESLAPPEAESAV